ncbi:MAG TPA: hypothetical protein VK824_06680, partial [Planctomycetota bacterium]|nr:hypothetical protein [Planctomycetota bacterium]
MAAHGLHPEILRHVLSWRFLAMKRLAVHSLIALLVLALHAPAQDKPSDKVATERARRDLVAQKNYLMVERHLANARAFEERLDLAAAEKELLSARELDPANRVVTDYLAQIQTLLEIVRDHAVGGVQLAGGEQLLLRGG